MDNVESHIKLVFRVFRATDDIESCKKYVDGHVRVLKIFGITMITSAKAEWFDDPDTYIILVQSEDGEKLYGGARVQVAGGKFPLPIETALSKFDNSIHSLVKELAVEGTGELCGLWNSREVAGLGIGSIFLGRVGVAIATQLKLKTLFALCAPATVKNCLNVGFLIENRLGDDGTFYYPKEDLVATAVLLNDIDTLSSADPSERSKIFELRQNPELKKIEEGPRDKILDIDFNLTIPNL